MVANGTHSYREALDAEGKSHSPKRWGRYINVPGMRRPLHRRLNGTETMECEHARASPRGKRPRIQPG